MSTKLKGINELKQENYVKALVESKTFFGSLFQKSSVDADIIILAFPYEDGKDRDECFRKDGALYGPDSLRRFFPFLGSLSNPDLSEDAHERFQSLKVCDLGNVVYENLGKKKKFKISQQTISMEDRLDALIDKLQECRFQTSQTLILLSSCRESIYGLLKGYFATDIDRPLDFKNSLTLIYFSNNLELGILYQHHNISPGSVLRKYVSQFPITSGKLRILFVGIDKNLILDEEMKFLNDNPDIFMDVIYCTEIETLQDKIQQIISSGSKYAININLEVIYVA